MMLINFISSLILCVAFTFFIIFIFGSAHGKLNKMPWYRAYLVKLGLCFCTTGALLNALTFSNPPWTEVMLNAGLALVFSWAAFFHYKEFICIPQKKIKKKKLTKKR